MIPALLDGAGNTVGDVAIAALITVSALCTYARSAFDYKRKSFTILSMLTAVGFTIVALRMWLSIALGIDITIAPVSQIGLTLVCMGYSGTQILAIINMKEMLKVDVRCMRDHNLPCTREDRVRAALAALEEKSK